MYYSRYTYQYTRHTKANSSILTGWLRQDSSTDKVFAIFAISFDWWYWSPKYKVVKARANTEAARFIQLDRSRGREVCVEFCEVATEEFTDRSAISASLFDSVENARWVTVWTDPRELLVSSSSSSESLLSHGITSRAFAGVLQVEIPWRWIERSVKGMDESISKHRG